jgi:NAD+ synthetase
MNYEKVFNRLVDDTQKYMESNNVWAMFLGISGGIDSTVTAAICHEVEKRNSDFKFFGISLPCTSNSETENNSALNCMKAFCKEGQYWTENLQKEYLFLKASFCQRHSPTTIGQGNIKARLRMMYLYDLANYMKGLVMDTDNLTEHYLGFFTIHGDVADLNPIGGLWKHEVYELARYIRDKYEHDMKHYPMSPDSFDTMDDMRIIESYSNKVKALEAALNITPTDGNGVNDLGDMGQIAPQFAHDNNYEAYKKVDDIIQTYLEYRGHHPEEYQNAIEELHKKYPPLVDNNFTVQDSVNDVISRINRTEYKRNRLPFVSTSREELLKLV